MVGFDKVIVAVSFSSSKVSTNIGTVNVCVVAPAAMVTVPEAAV